MLDSPGRARRWRGLVPLAATLAVVAAAAPAGSPASVRASRLKTERFDADPRWDGERNRIAAPVQVKRQDFGYQPGPAGRRHGRIGGVVWRSLTPSFYGMRLRPQSLEDRLSASGTLALTQAKTTVGYQNGSTIFIGFFNRCERGWRPVNFLGFRLEGYNEPDGATVEVSYGTRLWTAGGAFVNARGGSQERNVRELDNAALRRVAPDGTKHRWSLEYDPTAGPGAITFTLDGATSVQPLRPEHRRQGAMMNRFGLFNAELPGNEMTAYLDDLRINGEGIDLSRDPRWDGENNRTQLQERAGYGLNAFGYSAAARAGGRRGALAGRAWRVQEPEFKGYYGDDVGRLTLADPLFAAGRIAFPRFSVDSGLHFGWFNAAEQGWPPKHFLGVYLDSLSSVGRFITPMYGTAFARRERVEERTIFHGAGLGGEDLLFYPDGRPYSWSLRYDPAAAAGAGTLTLGFGTRSQTIALSPDARSQGALMNRFGVFNMQDNNGKDCVFYLDDLRYTTGR